MRERVRLRSRSVEIFVGAFDRKYQHFAGTIPTCRSQMPNCAHWRLERWPTSSVRGRSLHFHTRERRKVGALCLPISGEAEDADSRTLPRCFSAWCAARPWRSQKTPCCWCRSGDCQKNGKAWKVACVE